MRVKSLPATVLLASGVVIFTGSFYPNYVWDNDFYGDLLELAGTALLLLGACIIIARISGTVFVKASLYTGSVSLVLARVLDWVEELTITQPMPLIGADSAFRPIATRAMESFGYICVFLAMLAILRQLVQLKTHAEHEHRRYLELYEASLLLLRVADMAGDAVFGFDREGVVRTWNRGAERLFGYAAPEAVGRHVSAVLSSRDEGFDEAFWELVLLSGGGVKRELTGKSKANREFPAEATFSPVLDENAPPGEQCVGISTVVRNIEEKKRAERELIASRNLLAGALHNADVGVFIVRDDFEVVEANARIKSLTGSGWRSGSSLERLAPALFPDDPDFLGTVREQVFGEGKPVEFRGIKVMRPDGQERICNLAVSPINDGEGQVVAAGGIAVDITDREALAAKLLESQKLEGLGRLAGGIAHDFNNILGGILGYASLMRQKLDEDDPHYKYAHSIEESAKRASELTQQLLTFSRSGPAHLQPVSLNSILDETVHLLRSSLDPNIQIAVEKDDALPMVQGDTTQIKQMVMNLLINASEAMAGAGAVRVATRGVTVNASRKATLSLEMAGPYVQFTVEDNGSGMSKEVCERIFEPFFSTKEKGSGYGLGLSVVYGIVQTHKGALRVESELGKGSRFEVLLPAAQGMNAGPAVALPPRKRPSESVAILAIDDEKLIRTLVSDVLEDEGYEVLCAGTGEEGLEVFEQNRERIGLAVVDLIMPGMGGAEALHELRRRDPKLPCIISSGHGLPTLDPDAYTDSRTRFVPKPYQVQDLVQTVQELLESSQEPGLETSQSV